MVENTRTGNVILLCNNESGIATTGVLQPCRLQPCLAVYIYDRKPGALLKF
jgi:hypothetical protein